MDKKSDKETDLIDYTQKDSNQNFQLIFSPRTEYSNKLDYEESLFNDLTINFDPITIKIIKKHFKERLGSLNNIEFISILKNHLFSWHPKLPNREKVLVKLLKRLFSEIDLNDNGSMEWAEFTNYIIHNSNSTKNKIEEGSYKLRVYSSAKETIDTKDLSENVGYAFYIDKFSLIGIVENDKSLIQFYDANSFRKLKISVDLKEVQKDIDYLEIKELNERAEKKKQQNEDDKAKIRQMLAEKPKTKSNALYESKKISQGDSPRDMLSSKSKQKPLRLTRTKSISKKSETELQKSKARMKPLEYNQALPKPVNLLNSNSSRKLTVISAMFIPDFDVLMISATNNRIVGWQFYNGEFRKANSITDKYVIERNYFSCSILVANSPQHCMSWDSSSKNLYSGQLDGKVLKWDLTKPFPVGILDIKKKKKEDKAFNHSESIKLPDLSASGSDDSSFDEYDYAIKLDKKERKRRILEKDDEEKRRIRKKHFKTLDEADSKIKKGDAVSFILLIKKIQLLAVSYYNGSIALWDTILMKKRKDYKHHKSVVFQMSYDSNKNLLFSCGLSHDIYVYDPFIDFPVYILSGHYGSISNLVCNEKDSELISMDVNGNIKIWDTQLLINFQTISSNSSFHNYDTSKLTSNLRMIYLSKQKKIMVYGAKIQFYETDKSLNPDLADDQIVFACFYDKVVKAIISFCLRKIKMWNPFTGKIKKVYEDPMGNEITAFAIDRNLKRSFLGDNTGRIKCFNMKNGKFLKNLISHDNEINLLVHSLSMNIVVSCSTDNIIKIHDDKELTETVLIKEIKILGYHVKSIAILDHLQRLAIGLSNGIIKIYDLEHFRYDSDGNSDISPNITEVCCMYAFKEVELILSAHISGSCSFIITPPNVNKFTAFCEFFNGVTETHPGSVPVSCIDFDYANKRLFLGDQIGCISCYDLKEIFSLIEDTRVENDNKTHNDLKISQGFVDNIHKLKINRIWSVEAHKESIKHIHYADIEPSIIITTSHDLRVKIFLADTGAYVDELKQISNKFNSVPIGIKYREIDPINKTPYEEMVMRSELSRKYKSIDEIQENNSKNIFYNNIASEYSKMITRFNAADKLLQHVKNSKLEFDRSNKWNLMIDIGIVKKEEEDELKEINKYVNEKETNILKAEALMQKKSIYNDKYQPLFIQEMDDAKLKEFSKVLSQKLRHVKLAISKAALGQNKYSSLGGNDSTNKDKSKEKKLNRQGTYNFVKQKKGKIKLQPLNYGGGINTYLNTFELTPRTIFKIFQENSNDLEAEIRKLKKPFQMLVKKTKINPKISKRNPSNSFDSGIEERENDEKILTQLLN